MALGTGLRLGGLVGLNVGDVFSPDGTPRVRVRIRREIAKGKRAGDVFLLDRLVTKLARFWKYKKRRGERLDPDAPLFCAQSGRRLSKRRVQFAWRQWQERAGFDRLYPFHSLRHSSVTNVYRATRDLGSIAAQRLFFVHSAFPSPPFGSGVGAVSPNVGKKLVRPARSGERTGVEKSLANVVFLSSFLGEGIAAGWLLVTEASGQVTDVVGRDDYLDSGDIVAGGLALHAAMLEVTRKALG